LLEETANNDTNKKVRLIAKEAVEEIRNQF